MHNITPVSRSNSNHNKPYATLCQFELISLADIEEITHRLRPPAN